ncbi:hypothetical protein DFH28DRAFT_1223957 [Melampsora americana]|nr:hypothetical protein DFH28DRAFT_1223957 [Melampsora americana]
MVRPSRFKTNDTSTSVNNSNNTPVTTEEVIKQASDSPAPPPQVPQHNARRTVHGPTSALTSFLKPQASTSAITEGPDETSAPETEPAELEEDVDSDDLDADHSNANGSSRGQSKTIKSGEPSNRPAQTTAATTATRNNATTNTSQKRDRDSPEPEMKPKPGKYADRKPGMIAICAECAEKFTLLQSKAEVNFLIQVQKKVLFNE